MLAARVERHLVARPRARASVGLGVDRDQSPPAARNVVRPVANVIKLFWPKFTDFRYKLQCLSLASFSSKFNVCGSKHSIYIMYQVHHFRVGS